MTYFMNRETGELLTYAEMRAQAASDYDLLDDTNGLQIDDLYEIKDLRA